VHAELEDQAISVPLCCLWVTDLQNIVSYKTTQWFM